MTNDLNHVPLAVECWLCGRPMILTIPLSAVELGWAVTCPDCIAEDRNEPLSPPDR